MIEICVRIQYESTKECGEIEWNGSSQKMPVQWIMKLRKKEAQKCGNLNLLTRQLMFNQQKQQSLTATATLLRNAHISRFQIECIFLPFGMVWYGIHSLSCIHTGSYIDILCSKALALSLLNQFLCRFLNCFLSFRFISLKIAPHICVLNIVLWFGICLVSGRFNLNRVCFIQFSDSFHTHTHTCRPHI